RAYRLEAEAGSEAKLKAAERRKPGPGEVEVEVEAAGVNPGDLVKAEKGATELGLECAGRVSGIGEGVTGLRMGEEVVALGEGAFASHLTTRAELVVARPAELDREQGAAL